MSLQMKYFVLKPKGDDAYAAASRAALSAYAKAIDETDSILAQELEMWVIEELRAKNELADVND